MKTLVILLLLPLAGLAQKRTYTVTDLPYEIDSVTHGIVYRGVIEVPGATADQLYTRAKAFMFRSFTNANAVIQLDDKAGGLLAGKGSLPVNLKGFAATMAGNMYYETPIEIRVKEGKYRYEISNLVIVGNGIRMNLDDTMRNSKQPPSSIVLTEKQYKQSLASIQPFLNLIEQLKVTMNSPAGKEDF